MRRDGRVRVFVYTRLFCLFASLAIAAGIKYGVPIEINHWETGRTPLKHMVDVTNEFGLKVLAEHNFLNDNNIAFSPYGLMGIMVALYEGVDGDSSYEIQRAMQLPWNRNVMRVGFRDIHRTLKTYFVPEEGFLAGLALNTENVIFNEKYVQVLRFYGFDIEGGQMTTPSYTTNATATSSPTTTNVDETFTTTLSTENMSTTDKEETTTNPSETPTTEVTQESTTMSVETTPTTATVKTTSQTASTNEVTSTTEMSTPVNVTSTTSPSEITSTTTATKPDMLTNEPSSTSYQLMNDTTSMPIDTHTETTANTTMSENIISTTESMVTAVTNITSTTGANDSTSGTVSPSTTSSTESTSTQNTSTSESATPLTTDSSTTGSVMLSTEATSSTESTSNTQNSSTSETATPSTETSSSGSTTNMQNMTAPGNVTPSTETMSPSGNTMNDTETVTNPISNGSMLENLARRKKSIDYLFTNPSYVDNYPLYRSFDVGPDFSKMGYGGDEEEVYFADDLKYIPPYVGYGGNQMFLANGIKNVEVTYMSYDAKLEHAYLPHLDASALRLPLDSDRYYLLLVLPGRRRAGELARLLARMARASDLSDVYSAMRPKRVRALVPSFFVKGHITLTTDLQRLGIRNVFQPRQSDFTPMTSQAGVYVRSIEQAVSVAIRKYSPDETKKIGHAANRQRAYFSATYPFLYFVMDANINVALMAGKLVDPLNSRIL